MLSKFHKVNNETAIEGRQFVVFAIGQEEFGVDITQAREIIDTTNLTVIPNAPTFVKGIINLRGEIVPVVDLKKRFSLSGAGIQSHGEKIIIIESDSTLIGIQVNDVKEIIRLNTDDIAEPPKIAQGTINRDYLSGIGKLDDRLLILLNLNRILSDEEIEQLEEMELE